MLMRRRSTMTAFLAMLALLIARPAWADGGAVVESGAAVARRSVADGLVNAGVDPADALAQVMQLTLEDLAVLAANPAMLQRAAGGESQLVFFIILIAIFVALIAAGASGGLSIG